MDKILDIFPFKKEILQKHLKFTADLSLVTSSEFKRVGSTVDILQQVKAIHDKATEEDNRDVCNKLFAINLTLCGNFALQRHICNTCSYLL